MKKDIEMVEPDIDWHSSAMKVARIMFDTIWA